MKFHKVALLFTLTLLTLVAGCSSPGGGYKSEATMVLTRVRDEMASNSTVTPATRKRLDDFVAKYQAEKGESMSFKNIKDVQGTLTMIESRPEMAMQWKQALQTELQKALRDLETEGSQ